MNEMYPNMRIITAKTREWESVYVTLIGNGSDDDEDGYFLDKGNKTLSIIFAKEDMERINRLDPMNEVRKRRDGSWDERDGDDVTNNSKRRRNKVSRVESRDES